MRCVICNQAELTPGTATVTLEHGPTTLLFKDVPAQVCPNCGEEFIDDAITAQLLATAETSPVSGNEVEIRHYVS